MRTLNTRGALLMAGLFLGLAVLGSACFPADTSVHFSVESGFYDEPVTLEITCAVPGADIYYTTDGSLPTTRSRYYDGPITLENVEDEYSTLSDYTGISYEDYVPEESMMKANVVRAVAFWGENGQSAVECATYFIGVDRQGEYGSVPIVSLIMEEDDLFDYETGIYTLGITYDEWYAQQEEELGWWELEGNFSNKGFAWERPVHVDYLPAQGSGFAQEMGVRIKGGATRIYNQKSLRLIARDVYGDNRVRYPLFGSRQQTSEDGAVETFKQFVLRSGGNDCNYSKVRDPLVQDLAQDMRMDTQRNAPCVVFINGEYWGLYTLTEEYSSHYIESHYGIDRDNVVLVKRSALEAGQESDYALFEEMFDFITQNDMSVEANYAKASALLDMGNAADFFAVQFYVDNVDGIPQNNNNWQMWRVRTMDSSRAYGDGRWRFMLYDMDGAADLLSHSSIDNDCLSPVLSGESTHSDFGYLLRSLCQSKAFRRELLLSLCDVRNIHFAPERLEAEMASLRSAYEPLMADSLYRFGPQSLVDGETEQYCQQELDRLEAYFSGRWQVFPQIVQQAFGLQAPISASISCAGEGRVMVNHSLPSLQGDYTGLYFPDLTVTLTALENDGNHFVRWEGDGCVLSDPFSPVTDVAFESSFSVRAIFESFR